MLYQIIISKETKQTYYISNIKELDKKNIEYSIVGYDKQANVIAKGRPKVISKKDLLNSYTITNDYNFAKLYSDKNSEQFRPAYFNLSKSGLEAKGKLDKNTPIDITVKARELASQDKENFYLNEEALSELDNLSDTLDNQETNVETNEGEN